MEPAFPAAGAELFKARQYYEAHEAWEVKWRTLPASPPKDRLQGWIMIAGIGILLAAGRLDPAARLAERAKELLASYDEAARLWLEKFPQCTPEVMKEYLAELSTLMPPPEL